MTTAVIRAAVVDRYGPPDVVRVDEVARPSPGRREVLVRVHAVAVTTGDARIRAARFPRGFGAPARLGFGVVRPRRHILGSTFSGVVEAVGKTVVGFLPGDEVCGMTGTALGARAEYVAVPVQRLARKPPAVSHDDAAGVLFGGTTALYFLRDKAAVGPQATVLVNGAAGAVGTNAVQLARLIGSTVTGVTSAGNAELVRALGATAVIDYTVEDLATVTDRFDAVFDTVGNLTIDSGRALLTPRGVLLLAVATGAETLRAGGNVMAGSASERVADFDYLLRLVADGGLTVVIDGVYDLADIAAAYARVDSGHKVGNVILHP